MKNLLLTVLLCCVTLISCVQEVETLVYDNTSPLITLPYHELDIQMQDSVDIPYVITSEEGLMLVEVTIKGERVQQYNLNGSSKYDSEIPIKGNYLNINKPFIVKIKAVDSKGNSSTEQITIHTLKPVSPLPFIDMGEIFISPQKPFLDIDQGIPLLYNTETVLTATETIDMIWVPKPVGASFITLPMIVAPNHNFENWHIYRNLGISNWIIKNNTKFRKIEISKEEFERIDGLDILYYYYNGQPPTYEKPTFSSAINKINADDVFSFETSEGKKGIGFVTGIGSDTNSAMERDGKIYIDIKILNQNY